MLIVIGADENNLDSKIAKRFGHANYYILYNTETKNFKAVENSIEGHNHENLQEFLYNGAEAFIVGNIGPHAFEILNDSKSKIFLARKMSVSEAIEKHGKEELEQLIEPTVKHSIGQKHNH